MCPRESSVHGPCSLGQGKEGAAMIREAAIRERQERARKETFRIRKSTPEPVFADYQVESAASGGRYRVALRGFEPGDSYCDCPDYRVNTLGTCKHIEAVIARLLPRLPRRLHGAKAPPGQAEVYLRYGQQLEVRCHLPGGASTTLRGLFARYFEPVDGAGLAEGRLRPGMLQRLPELLAALQ